MYSEISKCKTWRPVLIQNVGTGEKTVFKNVTVASRFFGLNDQSIRRASRNGKPIRRMYTTEYYSVVLLEKGCLD